MDGALSSFRPPSRAAQEGQVSRRQAPRARSEAHHRPTAAASRNAYPFSAIVGQEEMKRALMIAAVDPSIGGVLVFGDRGTGKSTAVRSLAALLPEMPVVAGCPFACDPAAPQSGCSHCGNLPKGRKPEKRMVPVPVVDLPLGTTEDRLAGALDIERALAQGVKAFEPGLLAAAHRGFLYIDEVNLLEDHLVDLLLDVAASGENVVAREGISLRHPARFVLIGSGNPEEGELRPQLLDRFGLSVEVSTPKDLASRVEVVCRRDAYDREAAGFIKHWSKEEAQTRETILAGRKRLSSVTLPLGTIEQAATLCMALGTDGLRGELTLVRAARALAALDGEREVTKDHLRRIAPSALRHRLRRNPLDEAVATARVEKALEDLFGS
ncbi:MAG: magnesium chelatase ATPase subunit I [Alphaproteobacteria bacterium]|nr:magnesium chelatase ATPase subunit I [Alphaproteobacteria bacterium]